MPMKVMRSLAVHSSFWSSERTVVERVVVDRRLDLEEVVVLDDLTLAPVAVVQLGVVAVHERLRLGHRLHVVVVLDVE